jgi:nucleoside-diphosphate-sugar epimerase
MILVTGGTGVIGSKALRGRRAILQSQLVRRNPAGH